MEENDQPELRALIDFLCFDDRPSAIFSKGQDHVKQTGQTVVYRNAEFHALGIGEVELQELVHRVRSELDGGQSCCSTGSVTTIVDSIEDFGNPFANDTAESLLQPAQNHTRDWTRYAVTDLSQWVEHVRSLDWASTDVGPMIDWSGNLRSNIRLVMSNPSPRLLIWGRTGTFIYNEACSPLFGEKHPACLGMPVKDVWSEIWDQIRPLIEAGYDGKVSEMKNMPLAMNRHGFVEETYWNTTLIPVTDSHGNVQGILDEITETTSMVISDRRRNCILAAPERLASAKTLPELWKSFCESIEPETADVPFLLLYSAVARDTDSLDSSNSSDIGTHSVRFDLQGAVGISASHPGISSSFSLGSETVPTPAIGMILPCLEAWNSRKPVFVTQKDGTLPQSLHIAIADRASGDAVQSVLIAPMVSASDEPLGIVVVGISPRCPFDQEYRLYFDVLIDVLSKAASFITLPKENRRPQRITDDLNIELAHQLRLITRQAERSEMRFSRMAATAPFGMFVFDADERPLHVNEAYLAMTGQTREEFSARSANSWRDRIHPDDVERFATAWDSVRQMKVPMTVEYRLKQPWTRPDNTSGQGMDGETWLLANAFPDVASDGKVLSVQGWLTDISHRKFSENLLARKLEDALENKRQTENFIDMTSHEMRNPLSAILQSADSIVAMLKGTNRPDSDDPTVLPANVADEVSDAAHTIILCAQHQKRIVDDILTLSKLDASLLIISPDASHPPSLIYKALKMYEAEISRSDIHASLIMEPSYEELAVDWVVLDASRLLQVVINLLTNAIKFTQFSGRREISITLGASRQRPTGHHHGVEFIPPRHNRPNPTLLAEWGSGEPLYLQIAVSDTGRGLNEDEMRVLFQRFSQASPKTYGQYGGSGLGLFISRELCELQGGQIGVFSCKGKTTFTFFVRAKKYVPDERPELTKRPTVPQFLSTANSPIVFHRRGSIVEEAKAVSQDSTVNGETYTIAFPTRQDGDEALPLSRQTTIDSDLHVLIVEDNLINQRVMGQQLRRVGCTVHIAGHGQECLDFLRQTSFCGVSETPLSVILLDLEMPTMDGLTCIREIRRMQADGDTVGHVPVIAVTANARSEQIAVALDAGMDSVVTKPFRIPELVPQMHALVAEVALKRRPG